MTQSLKSLLSEHQNLSRLLDALEALVEEPAIRVDLLSQAMHYLVYYPDQYHHPLESKVFAALRSKDGSLGAVIDSIEDQHKELGLRAKGLAEQLESDRTSSAAFDAIRSDTRDYVRALRAHMEEEESQLFKVAGERLDPQDWEAIEAERATLQDPFFAGVSEHYAQLRDYVESRVADEDSPGHP